MKYEAVIFDFDGTLLYTVQDLADAVNYAVARRGYPTHSVRAIERMIGNGVNMLVSRALPRGFDTPEYERIMDDFRAFYRAHCQDNTRPYDGVPEMLARLRAEGRKLAIVTNKYQTAAELLRKQFFADSVELIVGDFEGRRRKPEPDGVLIALEKLGADPSRAVYVGDTEVDMQTAENAGLDCICVAWGYRTRQELERLGAPAIAENTQELLAML